MYKRQELDQITEALPPRAAMLVHFLAGSGLRFGEATALLGADLTLPGTASAGGSAGAGDGAVGGRGVVSVSKAWRRDPAAHGRFVIGAPKTRRGKRTVTLPGRLSEQLAEHLEQYEMGSRDLVFPSVHGGHLSIQELHRAWATSPSRPPATATATSPTTPTPWRPPPWTCLLYTSPSPRD